MSKKKKDLIAKLTLDTVLSEVENSKPSRSIEQLNSDEETVHVELDLTQFEANLLRDAAQEIIESSEMLEGTVPEYRRPKFNDLGDCLDYICMYFLENWENPWFEEDDEDDDQESIFGEIETFELDNSVKKLMGDWTANEPTETCAFRDSNKDDDEPEERYGLKFYKVESNECDMSVTPSEELESTFSASIDWANVPSYSSVGVGCIWNGDLSQSPKYALDYLWNADLSKRPKYSVEEAAAIRKMAENVSSNLVHDGKSYIQRVIEEDMRRQIRQEVRRQEKSIQEDMDMTEFFDHVYGISDKPSLNNELEVVFDGARKTFRVHENIEFREERVHLNGLRQERGVEYTVTGPQEISFEEPPRAGDSVIIDYF